MDPGQSIVILFGSLGVIGAVIARMWFTHEERKLKIRSQSQSDAGGETLRSEFDSLRAEVARLRDTSTQYDISIQHSLEDMQNRLERLESKRAVSPAASGAQEPVEQTAGVRGP